MSAVVSLRGPGWNWRPTYRFIYPTEGSPPVRVLSGLEILVDADGRHLRRQDDDSISIRSSGVLIQRQTAPADRAPCAPVEGGAA